MGDFVETPQGYVNLAGVLHLKQEPAGHYRVRWMDGTVQVLPQGDGDAIAAGIRALREPTRPRAGAAKAKKA